MNTRLTDCAKCGAPVVRSTDVGLTLDCDITPLTPRQHAQAWIDGKRVYTVGSYGARTVWVRRSFPAPISRPRLIDLLADDRHEQTVLVRHECPGALVCLDDALDRWMPQDRQVIAPSPVKAATSNGVPF
jgi:hypothetical protein